MQPVHGVSGHREKGGFPKRLMHLLGNNKTGGGAGYPNESIPACASFSKPYK